MSVEPGEVLTDHDYEALANAGLLVRRTEADGSDSEVRFEQAALDVHLGAEAVQLVDQHGCRREVEPDGGCIVIRPGEILTVATQEKFTVPADLQGQVSPKGRLTAIGLFFPTTHVDPGFNDKLYLPIFNAGPNTARIPIGTRIGKVEFQRLARAVESPWQGGSAFAQTPSAKLVQPGENLEQRVTRLSLQLRVLTWFTLILGVSLWVAVLDFDEFDWDVLTSEAVKTWLQPLLVPLLTAAVLGAGVLLLRGARLALRKTGLSKPDGP